jgi:hypothetical protein
MQIRTVVRMHDNDDDDDDDNARMTCIEENKLGYLLYFPFLQYQRLITRPCRPGGCSNRQIDTPAFQDTRAQGQSIEHL